MYINNNKTANIKGKY